MFVVLVLVLVYGGYTYWKGSSSGTPTSNTYYVAQTVATGTVSTGIEASGKIAAAEIIDLNIYKLTDRITSVGVVNGQKVTKGDLLFSFDQSDTSVAVNEARIRLEQARLALTEARGKSGDTNTTVTGLKNDIATLERTLENNKTQLRDALRTYFNEDRSAEPGPDRYDQQIGKTAPVISGTYDSTIEGTYTITVYASNEDSGFSYALGGLETGLYPVRPGVETKLGTRGLTITFPTSAISTHDMWVVALPNTYAANYPLNSETYEQSVANIQQSISSNTTSLENKKILLAQAERGDTSAQRSTDVATAELAVQQAQVDLDNALHGQTERRVVAAFDGTVEGMENVVVGATPTKDSNDPIVFGSLISDEFHASFSLSSNDVDRVSVGQKVLVSLTSVPNSEPIVGEISEISSLPDSGSTAQYSVVARIDPASVGTIRLRDGMLADIQIVKEEKANVLRVPTSAITYRNGQAYATIITNLNDSQQQELNRLGIVTKGSSETTYERAIHTGLSGQYYTEVTDGLSSGDTIVISSTTKDTSASNTVVRTGFGGGSNGTRRPD